MWVDDYIGIPFGKNGSTRESCDCWRLVVMVYKDKLNIDLPDFSGIFVDGSLASLRKVTKHIRETKKAWQKVDKPLPFDVILLRTGSMVYHCGVVIGRRTMLHVMDGINSTIEEFTSLQWKQKIEGFYRWKTEK